MYESSTKETKWVCIQLACSWRPRAFEEAHRRNIQAKFYNEKFPLVWTRQLMRLTIWRTRCYFEAQYMRLTTWRTRCYFEAQVWKKRDSSIALVIYFHFFGLSLFCIFFFVRSLIPTCGGIIVSIILSSLGQCSNNDDHHTSIDYNIRITTRNLEQDMTLYECLRRCTGMVQWIKSDMYEK